MKICYVISDHGFGHAARSCCVIRGLLAAGHEVCVVTDVPNTFLLESIHPETVGNCIHFIREKTDVGLLQADSVTIDFEQTITLLEKFVNELTGKAKRVTETMTTLNTADGLWIPDVLLSDVSILGVVLRDELNRIQQKVSVKTVLISNFTWIEIYSAIEQDHPNFSAYIKIFKSYYAKADKFIRLPFATEVEKCGIDPSKILHVDGVSRTSTAERNSVRTKLRNLAADTSNLSESVYYLLFSFGGFASPIDQYVAQWKPPPSNWRVIWIDRNNTLKGLTKPGVTILTEEQLVTHDINYMDLLISADVALIKTGFGIVSECICYNIPVLYVDRPGFVEHLALVKALTEHVPTAEITLEDAVNCNVFDQCESLIKQKERFQGATNTFQGVKQVVDIITNLQ